MSSVTAGAWLAGERAPACAFAELRIGYSGLAPPSRCLLCRSEISTANPPKGLVSIYVSTPVGDNIGGGLCGAGFDREGSDRVVAMATAITHNKEAAMSTLRTVMTAATLAFLAACEPTGPIIAGLLAEGGGEAASSSPSLYDPSTSPRPGPFTPDAYGPGVGMDQYGRAVRHDPFMKLTPNAYGLGVGSDQYGRPVYHGM